MSNNIHYCKRNKFKLNYLNFQKKEIVQIFVNNYSNVVSKGYLEGK